MRRRGSALIEFAFVAPVLIILLLLMIQYSLFMNTSTSLNNLAREGARFAAIQPASDAAIIGHLEQAAQAANINWAHIQNNIVITPPEGDSSRTVRNTLIDVQISYDMANKRFLPATFFGMRIFNDTFVAHTTMMVEG